MYMIVYLMNKITCHIIYFGQHNPRHLHITDLSLHFSNYLCIYFYLFYIYVATGLLDFSAEEIRLEACKANADGKGDTYVSVSVGF